MFQPTNKDVEIILLRNCEAFSLAYKKKGRFGYPTNFIEKKFQVLIASRPISKAADCK